MEYDYSLTLCKLLPLIFFTSRKLTMQRAQDRPGFLMRHLRLMHKVRPLLLALAMGNPSKMLLIHLLGLGMHPLERV